MLNYTKEDIEKRKQEILREIHTQINLVPSYIPPVDICEVYYNLDKVLKKLEKELSNCNACLGLDPQDSLKS